jgi:hypothetical protein
MPSLPAARFSTRPSLRTRCFHFYGWGGFEIRLARRRAHPCDEQGVASTCSFPLFLHVKVLVSILWVGPGHGDTAGTPPEIAGASYPPVKRRSVGGDGEIRRSSINIMEICYISGHFPLVIVARGRNFRRRKILVRAQKPKICGRKIVVSAG